MLSPKVSVCFVKSPGELIVLSPVVFDSYLERVVVKIYLEVSFGRWIFQKVRSDLCEGSLKKSLDVSLTMGFPFADHNISLVLKKYFIFLLEVFESLDLAREGCLARQHLGENL